MNQSVASYQHGLMVQELPKKVTAAKRREYSNDSKIAEMRGLPGSESVRPQELQ